jgi:hypothetical protein
MGPAHQKSDRRASSDGLLALSHRRGKYAAMAQEAPLKIYARGVVSYFYFSRAPRARALKIWQINSAILKVPDGAWIR